MEEGGMEGNLPISEHLVLGGKGYAADNRFAPAGPRPPVPPVGGKITFNDDAGTINKNISCLQSFTQKISKKQNI